MKLVHFFENPSSSPGGTEKMMERITEVASGLGFDCEEVNEMQFSLRRTSNRLTMLNPLGNICQMSWLARKRLAEADVIVSHGIYGAFLRSKGRIHVLHSTHSGTADAMRAHIPRLDHWVARHLWGGVFERLSLRAERCVAVSDFVVKQANRYYGKACEVVPNTISQEFAQLPVARVQLRARLELPVDKVILLVVGRRERLKGWSVVTSLLDELPEEVILLSVGQGEGASHPNLITRGSTSSTELVEYYNAVDWLLSPSLYEGFGLTLLEAWQCGTPVIASPTGVASDLHGIAPELDACVAGLAGCPGSLRKAIVRALGLADQGKAQVAWGQATLKERFSPDAFRRKWTQLLATAISTEGGRVL